jgi:hypothetical protein
MSNTAARHAARTAFSLYGVFCCAYNAFSSQEIFLVSCEPGEARKNAKAELDSLNTLLDSAAKDFRSALAVARSAARDALIENREEARYLPVGPERTAALRRWRRSEKLVESLAALY